MAELFRLIWKPEEEANLEALFLEWDADKNGRATASFWKNDNIKAMVFRWIRGFHYSLYGEYLPLSTDQATLMRFLEIKPDGSSSSHYQFRTFAEAIRRQRMTNQLDRIIAYNGRLLYECAWFIKKRSTDLCLCTRCEWLVCV